MKMSSEDVNTEQNVSTLSINSEEISLTSIKSTSIYDSISIPHRKNEDEYDTDIEDKEEHVSYDHSGKTAYIKHCYKEGVIPAGYFLRHISDKRMEIKHHGLGVTGIRPICLSLMTNGSITSLDLTDNWLGDESVSFLMAMMKENCFIAELILTKNNFTSKCACLFAFSLSENFQLTRLDLSQNCFDDHSAQSFADLIVNVPKLEYLNLSKNKFGSNCMSAFGKALSQTTTLIEFDLSWNHISGKEIKQFCSGIAENVTLKILNLGWNGFGSDLGMQDFGKCLKTNVTLEELILTNNRITPEGAVLLGRGLILNKTLKTLRIGQNPMQTAGCYALLNSVIKNPNTTITLLDFEDIRVNQDFIDLKSTAPSQIVILTGSRKPVRPSSSIHPIVRLKTFVKKRNLSLVKYFNHFDDAENMNLTVNDFVLSLRYFCQDTSFDLTENEMTMLVESLDKNQKGFISYKDFIEIGGAQ